MTRLQALDEIMTGQDAGTKAGRMNPGHWVLTPALWNCRLLPSVSWNHHPLIHEEGNREGSGADSGACQVNCQAMYGSHAFCDIGQIV